MSLEIAQIHYLLLRILEIGTFERPMEGASCVPILIVRIADGGKLVELKFSEAALFSRYIGAMIVGWFVTRRCHAERKEPKLTGEKIFFFEGIHSILPVPPSWLIAVFESKCARRRKASVSISLWCKFC